MKPPSDIITGTIAEYDERSGELIIRAPYSDYYTLTKREYKNVRIQLIDGRTLSSKQRRSCYAMITEIADYMGEEKAEAKDFLKQRFMANELEELGDAIFSLSDAPMSLVAAFQRFLARFIVRHDIPTKKPMLDYVDDIGDYVYSCLIHKKCAICGRHADLHHHKRIGSGRNREKIDQIGWPVQPLCRAHHIECHSMTQNEFDEKYHIIAVPLDKTMAKLWGINGTRKTN